MTLWIHHLDRLHAWARAHPLLYRVVLATRILFATAFIPTGLVKLLGLRFTSIPTSDPIGAFFEAMYQTGGYWRFLGATQVAAGLLLLVPRAARRSLGAMVGTPGLRRRGRLLPDLFRDAAADLFDGARRAVGRGGYACRAGRGGRLRASSPGETSRLSRS